GFPPAGTETPVSLETDKQIAAIGARSAIESRTPSSGRGKTSCRSGLVDQAYLLGYRDRAASTDADLSTLRRGAAGCHRVCPVASLGTMSVTQSWSIAGLLRDLAARGQHPAVISFGEDGVATLDSATVADRALRLARGLRDAGFASGSRV